MVHRCNIHSVVWLTDVDGPKVEFKYLAFIVFSIRLWTYSACASAQYQPLDATYIRLGSAAAFALPENTIICRKFTIPINRTPKLTLILYNLCYIRYHFVVFI